MIPRSITVRGFLCYKDEQVIDLDGCDLWVLAGRNGSGKSAIFDAMTFALFKAHRGGKQEAASLIHTDASELSVCFEFDLGDGRYRIKRTVPRRGAADRGVYRFAAKPDGTEGWPSVPETQAEKGLDRWVRENIGLTYETFTASVLLLQGRPDSLIGAKPAARLEIIAGIVDLESYRDLHARAEARRQQRKGQSESLRDQLRSTPVIEPAAIEQAEHLLVEVERAGMAAKSEWGRLVGLRAQAKTWIDLVDRREKASAKREHNRQLIAGSEAIARDWNRLRELDAVLPAVRGAITRREAIAGMEAQSRSGEDERKTLFRKLDLIASLAEDNRRHLETIVAEIGRDEARDRVILERQAALAIPIQRASQARTQREEVRRLEGVLASYPADLMARVADLEEAERTGAGWKAALPSLATLARERSLLAEARGRRLAAQRTIDAGAVEANQAGATLAGRHTEELAAGAAESQARDRATGAATLVRAAVDRLAQFEGLDGLTNCDRCGQALTPEHFEAEAIRLREERDRAVETAETAESTHSEARSRLDTAKSARAEAERSLEVAEQAVESARRDLVQAGRDADRNAGACYDTYGCLDDPFRIRVAAEPPEDWAATSFPAAGDLEEGRRLVAEFEGVRSRLRTERGQLDKMEADRTRLDQANLTLAAVAPEPGDDTAEAEHNTLQAELESLARCLKSHATEKALADQNYVRLDEHDRGLRDRLIVAEGTLATARARLESLRDEAARARTAAPESWREALDSAVEDDIAPWDEEQESLRAQNLDSLVAELPQAHLLFKQAEADLVDLEFQTAALPEEARRDPDAIADSISGAEAGLSRAEEDRRSRQATLDRLQGDRDGRLDLESRALAADRDLTVARTLADLLGPRGLQRHLIRDAERGIVAYANPILREVSGGELELRLIDVGDGEPDHALQLEAIERVHGRTGTRGVEYLSGSQKFRVAVSLALAIGQYARGGQGRPIESVIIDEGFGSLDRQGRDEMIEQLNALRGRLARIVLVSHQDEFAEAFRDGYRFEVIEGSTVARPFHR